MFCVALLPPTCTAYAACTTPASAPLRHASMSL